MPTSGIKLLAKEVLTSVVQEVRGAFDDEGYKNPKKRVFSGDVPDTALDPYALLEVNDNVHSDYEDKGSPVEVVFIGVSIFATETGATKPYVAALDLSKSAASRITDEGFDVEGLTVFENRLGLNESASLTGPEQISIFGFSQQYEIHVE
jgi:hypothetical protein